jgi:hypothetical protein
MSATSGAGLPFLSVAYEFSGVRVAPSLVFCFCFVDYCLSFLCYSILCLSSYCS